MAVSVNCVESFAATDTMVVAAIGFRRKPLLSAAMMVIEPDELAEFVYQVPLDEIG